MSLDAQSKERLVQMLLYEVPVKQIASALGISEGRVSQLSEEEEVRERLSLATLEHMEEDRSINDGWNSVEAVALTTLLEGMQFNKDPDFALKAAMTANRAQRRGQLHNQPLNGQVGTRAVIILNNTFVKRLQQISVNGAADDGSPRTIESNEGNGSVLASKTDFLPAQHVEKLLLRRADGEGVDEDTRVPDLLSAVGDLANSILFPDLPELVPAE